MAYAVSVAVPDSQIAVLPVILGIGNVWFSIVREASV